MVKKNYESYENIKKLEELGNDDDDDDEDEGPKKHDFKFIKNLWIYNRRKGSDVVASFAHQLLTERDTKMLSKYFVPYFAQLISENQLKRNDYEEGLSMILGGLPELVMDSPKIHELVFNYMIKPLLDKDLI